MINLYSLASCSKCQVLKHELLKEKIQFKTIEDIPTIQEEMLKAETMSVPFIKIGERYIIEPNIKKIKEAL